MRSSLLGMGIGLVAAAATAMLARPAEASIILDISTHSSEAGVDPTMLSASLEFEVVGNTVTLTVTNHTSGANGFHINELYFNAPDAIGSLTQVTGHTGWTFHAAPPTGGGFAAGMFGRFKYALIDGVGGGAPTIGPSESLTWVFEFTGTATATDFGIMFSHTPPGGTPSIVAAKFVMGPDDASAFGATNIPIPAPGAAVLLLAAFAGRRRRRT